MVVREQVELVVLDALEQTGARAGDVGDGTRIDALGLCDVEYRDLAADFAAEFGISFTAEELRTARDVRELVDRIVRRTAAERSSSP
jgi:hypothetical protein